VDTPSDPHAPRPNAYVDAVAPAHGAHIHAARHAAPPRASHRDAYSSFAHLDAHVDAIACAHDAHVYAAGHAAPPRASHRDAHSPFAHLDAHVDAVTRAHDAHVYAARHTAPSRAPHRDAHLLPAAHFNTYPHSPSPCSANAHAYTIRSTDVYAHVDASQLSYPPAYPYTLSYGPSSSHPHTPARAHMAPGTPLGGLAL